MDFQEAKTNFKYTCVGCFSRRVMWCLIVVLKVMHGSAHSYETL